MQSHKMKFNISRTCNVHWHENKDVTFKRIKKAIFRKITMTTWVYKRLQENTLVTLTGCERKLQRRKCYVDICLVHKILRCILGKIKSALLNNVSNIIGFGTKLCIKVIDSFCFYEKNKPFIVMYKSDENNVHYFGIK